MTGRSTAGFARPGVSYTLATVLKTPGTTPQEIH